MSKLTKKDIAVINKALHFYKLCNLKEVEIVDAILEKTEPPKKEKVVKFKRFGKNPDGSRFRYDKRGIKWTITKVHFPNNAFGYRNFYYAESNLETDYIYRGDSYSDCYQHIDNIDKGCVVC